ncbi:MAG: FecR domain-containing protein [Massilibacteroides sp.]|nr:FecR domain-containing protein [Massilibacteroides sp.]MDD3063574.1 FecR domain-containing protein [Massilibacteroides sp.]MDD4114247.1 FecR domain-containing protein [Massilibacteroides sp.]MDD4660999.1 FecR domain-containing protein [Massilibacteroides sp.]
MTKNKQEKKEQFSNVVKRIFPLFKYYESEKFGKDAADSWDTVNQQIKAYEHRHLRKRILYFTSAACILSLIIGSLFYLIDPSKNKGKTFSEITSLIPAQTVSTKEILLVTANEEKLNIENNTNVTYNPDGSILLDSKTINQKKHQKEKVEPVYNQIIVPKGKRTKITFADSTCVYINSGTRVIYPSIFANDKREIYVEGEIYLNVKRDEKRPFYVKTKNMNVRVLGTSFNVCAYTEDEESSVVLVSGKVEIETQKKEKVILSPDELFSVQPHGVRKQKVNASEYVCWTQNMIIFNKEPLDKILIRLSRYYGEPITWDTDLSKMTISGKLDLRDNLEEVMRIISSTAPVAFTHEQTFHVKLKNKKKNLIQ